MGVEKLEWSWDDGNSLLIEVSKIPQVYWANSERNVLNDEEAPEQLKNDLNRILEVTNSVYEGDFEGAHVYFFDLTNMQKMLLSKMVEYANNCGCEKCVREREEELERRENIEKSISRIERIGINSRMKTYEVSEDIYNKLANDRIRLERLVSKLDAAVELLDEEDPRYGFALSLVEACYGDF